MSGLSFDEAGSSGRPLILVHGWCCNRRHMAPLVERFADAHRVFAVDLPGHGQTPLGEVPPLLEAFAAALADFLAQRSLSEALLIGHSMGGVVSVLAAGQHPERVAGVVNLDGALPLTPQARAAYRALFEAVRGRDFAPWSASLSRRRSSCRPKRGRSRSRSPPTCSPLRRISPPTLLGHFPTLDAEHALRAYRAPLLYIGSSHPRFDEAELIRLRPDAWIARVAGSGHFVQIFALPQVVAMIGKFLESGLPR